MLIITLEEYNNKRLCELDNRLYKALVSMMDKRTGGTGKAGELIRKHWNKTLKQFDNNGYLAICEVFRVA